MTEFIDAASNFSSAAIMAGFAWALLWKIIPAMQDKFHGELAETRVHMTSTLTEIRSHMTQNLVAIRKDSAEQRSTFNQAIIDLSEKFDHGLACQRKDFQDDLALQRQTVDGLADKIDSLQPVSPKLRKR